MYECLYCGKTSFKTERGLEQHLARSSYCRGQQKVEDGDVTGYYTAEEGMAYTTILKERTALWLRYWQIPTRAIHSLSPLVPLR